MSIRKLSIAAGLFLLVPLTAMAQGTGHPGHHRGPGRGDLSFLAGVQLTAPQKQQVHQLVHASYAQIGPLEKQMRSLNGQIADTLASTASVDQAQLSSLQQQVEQLRGQIDQQRLSTALQVRAVLTPAQLAQAAQVHQQLQSLHQQIRTVLSQAKGSSSAQ
jgi:periplasmic protein CpxP/Spy